MKVIDVNTHGIIEYSKKLDLMGKKLLPLAVRNTLNTLAFDTKKKYIPQEADKSFTIRNKTFYKRFSRVEMANGNNINSMQSKVGMVGDKQAVENQKAQQLTGTIGGRALIPMDTARVNNDNKRNVKAKNRIKNINVVMDSVDSKGGTHKKRFIQTAVKAVERFGSGAVIKHKTQSGKTFLYRIEIGGNDLNTRQFGLKVTPLYSVQRGRTVSIDKAKPFTLIAAEKAANEGGKIFVKQAKRVINKLR